MGWLDKLLELDTAAYPWLAVILLAGIVGLLVWRMKAGGGSVHPDPLGTQVATVADLEALRHTVEKNSERIGLIGNDVNRALDATGEINRTINRLTGEVGALSGALSIIARRANGKG